MYYCSYPLMDYTLARRDEDTGPVIALLVVLLDFIA